MASNVRVVQSSALLQHSDEKGSNHYDDSNIGDSENDQKFEESDRSEK